MKKTAENGENSANMTAQSREKHHRMLQTLIDNAPRTHLVYLDRDFNFLAVNATYARTCNRTPEELIGKNHFSFYPHEENERIFRQARDSGEPVSFQDKPFVFPDQPERGVTYWDWTLTPLKDSSGNAEGLIFSLTETTKRRKAEEALKRGEARFKLLSDTASRLLATDNPQGIVNELCREVMAYLDCQAFFNFLVDEDAQRLHLNACAGIPEEEARKIEWLDYGVAVCGCAARDRHRIIAEDIFNTPDIRTELVKSYGVQAYCCHPLMSQGRLIGTLSFGTKTRAHYTAEEVEVMRIVADQVAIAMQRIIDRQALRDSEEKYRTLFEEAPFPVFEWDFSWAKRCLGGSPEIERQDLTTLLQCHPEDAKRCMSLMNPIHINRQGLQRHGVKDVDEYNRIFQTASPEEQFAGIGRYLSFIMRGELQGSHEATIVTARGDKMDILARWTVIPGYEESLEKVLISTVDITEVKTLQAALLRKSRELEDFVHHLSHNMKNGLLVIKRWSELALSSPDVMLHASSQLTENVDTLIRTVDRLLALLRSGTAVPDKKDVALKPLVDEIFESMKRLDFRSELIFEDDTRTLRCDPAMMREIFSVLLANSFRYRDPEKDGLLITIKSERMDASAKILYRDNGLGITGEHLEKIFHTWFTPERKEPRGFGLSIVKKLVESQGGTVMARSDGPGQGSQFVISLPVN